MNINAPVAEKPKRKYVKRALKVSSEKNIQDPVLPVQDPVLPVQAPVLPVQDPVLPVQAPVSPVQASVSPVQDQASPVQDPASPVQDPAIQEPTQISIDTTTKINKTKNISNNIVNLLNPYIIDIIKDKLKNDESINAIIQNNIELKLNSILDKLITEKMNEKNKEIPTQLTQVSKNIAISTKKPQSKPQSKPQQKENNLSKLLQEYKKTTEEPNIPQQVQTNINDFFKQIYIFNNTNNAINFATKLDTLKFDSNKINIIDNETDDKINKNLYNLLDSLEHIINEDYSGHFLFITDNLLVNKLLHNEFKHISNLINMQQNVIHHYYVPNPSVNIKPTSDNFDEKYYQDTNSDLTGPAKNLFRQWKSNGLKKNNIGKPDKYDYDNNNNYFAFSMYLDKTLAENIYILINKKIKDKKGQINISTVFRDVKFKEEYVLPFLFIRNNDNIKYVNNKKYM